MDCSPLKQCSVGQKTLQQSFVQGRREKCPIVAVVRQIQFSHQQSVQIVRISQSFFSSTFTKRFFASATRSATSPPFRNSSNRPLMPFSSCISENSNQSVVAILISSSSEFGGSIHCTNNVAACSAGRRSGQSTRNRRSEPGAMSVELMSLSCASPIATACSEPSVRSVCPARDGSVSQRSTDVPSMAAVRSLRRNS